MRVAALYDIHANLPALEAVLADVRSARVDAIIVGGDVLPGPMPRETMDRLAGLDVPARFIHGNGDREVLATMRGAQPAVPEAYVGIMRWVAGQLGSEHERVLASWPPTITVDVTGIGAVLFCHATPRNDTEIFTRETPEDRLSGIFGTTAEAVVVCGHTHMQFDRRIGASRVVNAGSVGMPFGAAGADWLLLGPDVEFRHTLYDLANAADRIRSTSYPQADMFAAGNVLNPPSAATMLALFGRNELR